MNLPNKLSFMRIFLVPLIYICYLAIPKPYGQLIAVALFIAAAITDQLDGHIARKTNQVTDLGKLLDPMADKLLYCGCMFLIVLDGTIPAPWGIIGLFIVFARDTLVNGIRQVGASKGVVFAAALSGKLKAIFAYIFIPMFMYLAADLGNGVGAWATIDSVMTILAYVVYGIAIAVTIWSAIDYTVKNKEVLKTNTDEK